MATELKNKFVYQLIISLTQVIFPLISYPYITRVLGPENLGRVNYVDFLVQIFLLFASFGIPFYAIREVARLRNQPPLRAALVKEMLVLLAIFYSIAVIVFFAVTFRQWPASKSLYILATINILLAAFSLDWYIQGMEAFKFSVICTLVVKLAMLLGFFIFIKDSSDYIIYYGIFTAGLFLFFVVNIRKLLSENKLSSGHTFNLQQHLWPLWHLFLTASAISIYEYFDVILLKQLTHNDAAVGQYSLVLKMMKICQVALLSLGVVLMPRLSYLASNDSGEQIKIYLQKLFQLLITFCIPVCTGLLLLAPEIIDTIAGEKFLPAVPSLRILSFLPLVMGISNLFAFQLLLPFKKEKKFLTAAAAGCIISLTLNFLLIPRMQQQGAAYANILTQIFITAATGWYAYRLAPFNPGVKMIVQTVCSSLLFVPLIMLLKIFFVSAPAILVSSVVSCMLLYYVLQYMVFKNDSIKEIQQYIGGLIRTKK